MVELGLREIRHYTKSDTIAKFKMIYEKLGTTPSITQLRSADTQLVYSIMLHFNRYNNFLDYLNIEYVLDYEHVEKTDEELINDYLDLCNHLGKLATLREVSSCEWTVSSEKYLERFGSIHRVREMAGLDVGKLGKPFYSREMLDRKITSVIKEYGRDISVKEFLFRLGCAKATLARYYGTTSIREVISIVSGKENEK